MEVKVNIKRHEYLGGMNTRERDPDLKMAEALAGALRDYLATFVSVVPGGKEPPLNAALLNIMIYEITYREPRNLGQYPYYENNWNEYVYSSERAERIYERLGYYAPKIRGKLLLGRTKHPRSVYSSDIPTMDIIRELKPIYEIRGYRTLDYKRYSDHTNREISRVFAETITKYLKNEFDWHAKE